MVNIQGGVYMQPRHITLVITACFSLSHASHEAMPMPDQRSTQDLHVVAHQFPHLLYNAFMALNHDSSKEERYEAFQGAVNNIVNIASLIRSANELTGDDIDRLMYAVDDMFEDNVYAAEPSHEPLIDDRAIIDTDSIDPDEYTAPTTRNAHVVAHNFPHLVLNAFIALNNDNDRTERHLAFYNAMNNIINIASVMRSYQYTNKENVYTILRILDTALGEDNIELRFADITD